MNKLDEKIKSVFPDEAVLKTPDRYQIFHGNPIPSFIKDWLIKKYTSSSGELNTDKLLRFMQNHIADKTDSIKRKLQTDGSEEQILCRMIVETDIKNNLMKFSIPDLGIKISEGRIPAYIAKKHSQLKDNEVWGIVKMVYTPPTVDEKGFIDLIDFKPFNPYKVNLDYYKDAAKKFSFEEWIDVLIRAMEYNSDNTAPGIGFDSIEKKHLFISRLMVFVENNLNVMELAPKGTGKSYVFGNLSKYGWMFSGGKISRAKLFYDMGRKLPGTIEQYDFITMDEIETISFSNESEMLGALKNYLESGKFSIANYNGSSEAGLMLLGNLPLNRWNVPLHNNFFKTLNPLFRNSALLDRFHAFIQGWDLIRVNEDMLLRGYSLNVEYFSEIMHLLRRDNSYSCIVTEMVEIPSGADTRDKNAIIKVATAYLKLLFPWVRDVEDVDAEQFRRYCLEPAIRKRAIIKEQIALLDPEFNPKVPSIRIKDKYMKF
ncbi:MAG: BREX system Lon protease-like protein BrxL [Candidatus Cloacimonetes bacterium]|jgi:ATP-dependent Lon protease|nr:BREX system Lon protease-like protein BrxL [Candidatus Cloacimonadota bacterium]